ncbi:hypothetical protein KSP40_PGU003872 [Platanthera guangdongensis]|uniref:Uncharacterized protein n=1 Tax=Platanthera guangdongensis TaxID=2320717 RepID=A0ABR2N0Q2_9ASPA
MSLLLEPFFGGQSFSVDRVWILPATPLPLDDSAASAKTHRVLHARTFPDSPGQLRPLMPVLHVLDEQSARRRKVIPVIPSFRPIDSPSATSLVATLAAFPGLFVTV